MAGSGGHEMSADRISKVAKGKRPVYFTDPATDKLMAIVLTLIGELSVTRDRLDALERLLHDGQILPRELLDHFAPSESVTAERDAARAAYLARLLRVVTLELQRTDDDGATESFNETLHAMLDSTPN